MNKKQLMIKVCLGILVIGIISIGGWWVLQGDAEKTDCSTITSMLNIQGHIEERIIAIGILECEKPGVPAKAGVHYLKFEDGTELRFLEEYSNCKSYNGKEVEVIGKLYQCGKFDQCAGIGLTDIESVNLYFKE